MKRIAIVFTALAACALARQASTADRTPVDLRALLDEMDRASPQLLAMRARADAAAAVAPQREALPDPTLSATYTNDGVSEFTLGDSEFANLAVEWEQEVPAKEVRRRAAALGDAEAVALRATASATQATLREHLIERYVELWRIDRTRSLLVESRELLETAEQAAHARYESGEGTQEGLIRAQTSVRRVDVEIEELSLARRQAEIELGATMGRAEDAEFGETLDLPDVVGPIDTDRLAAGAAETSPEVLQAMAGERRAEASLDDARVQVKPTYSWVAGYQFRGGLDPMVMGGFSVRLPVWKNDKQQRVIEGATLARTAAARDREDVTVRARARARALVAEIKSIDARMRLYRDAIVPQTLAAYESAKAAFGSGRAEMFLVLDDLDRWVRARTEAIGLEARHATAIASLEAISGTALFDLSSPGRTQ